MKLYVIENVERDWIAANTESEALTIYRNEYGLSDRDMEDVKIAEESSPDRVEVFPDDWDYDSDDDPPTAAEMMEKMKAPGLVCSTCQ